MRCRSGARCRRGFRARKQPRPALRCQEDERRSGIPLSYAAVPVVAQNRYRTAPRTQNPLAACGPDGGEPRDRQAVPGDQNFLALQRHVEQPGKVAFRVMYVELGHSFRLARNPGYRQANRPIRYNRNPCLSTLHPSHPGTHRRFAYAMPKPTRWGWLITRTI